jgi:hypothetical protein
VDDEYVNKIVNKYMKKIFHLGGFTIMMVLDVAFG